MNGEKWVRYRGEGVLTMVTTESEDGTGTCLDSCLDDEEGGKAHEGLRTIETDSIMMCEYN